MSIFIFRCFGHPNVLAEHKTTLEFTTDNYVSQKGDCIIGVRATKDLCELDDEMKEEMRKKGSRITVQINANGLEEIIRGDGSPDLVFSDKGAIIIRKSSFICPRTLMINSNKAAKDLSREIIEMMKNESTVMEIVVQVEEGSMDTSKQA